MSTIILLSKIIVLPSALLIMDALSFTMNGIADKNLIDWTIMSAVVIAGIMTAWTGSMLSLIAGCILLGAFHLLRWQQ